MVVGNGLLRMSGLNRRYCRAQDISRKFAIFIFKTIPGGVWHERLFN
jgi:hypothetical protein